MKIAIISENLLVSGGGQRELLELANKLIKLGHEVDVFSNKLNKKKCYPNLTKKIDIYTPNLLKIKLKKNKSNTNIIIKIYNFIFNNIINIINNHKFIKIIKENDIIKQYDIINYHDSTIFLSGHFQKNKNFWMMNDLPGILDLEIKGLFKKDTLFNKVYYIFYKNILTKRISNINKIIVLDNINKKIVKKYFGLNAKIVRSGIEKENFYYKKNIYKNKKKYTILCTGIFFKHRRYEDVIEGLNILINKKGIKNLELNIIGKKDTDIIYYNKIYNLVIEKKLEKYVNFKGVVTEKELVHSYRNSDFFIFPNSPQTWGLAVFEAILSGCLTIVSKGCGAHEVLKDNYTSCIIEPKCPNLIANKIELLIKNPKIAQNILKNGQKYVLNNISWETYSKGVLNIFNKKLGK